MYGVSALSTHSNSVVLLLLSNCTKYDHELTLHKIVNARNWAYMCVLFVHMCIMVRVEYTICAHGYQSVYLEGLIFIQMTMWQMAQGKLYYFSYGYKIYLVNEIMISTISFSSFQLCDYIILIWIVQVLMIYIEYLKYLISKEKAQKSP